jgi:hypothetical protein
MASVGPVSESTRDRVKAGMAAFASALDAAMADPTPEALNKLREATDRLMRAAGRVLIELDRVRKE